MTDAFTAGLQSHKEWEVFEWSRSQIFLSDSGSPIRSFFASHSYLGNSCGNGTISYETFVETEFLLCTM